MGGRRRLKLAFLGTPEAAVPSLEALARAGHEVALAVTRPDRAVGRSRRPEPPPVKRAAAGLGIPVVQPGRVRGREFVERLERASLDALVVVAYGKILPREVFELPPLGSVNVHFSLLPRYRGAAPVQWALARGETVTGVTTMQIAEGLDEGDILLQQEVAIEPGEHAPSLESRLARVGAELLVQTLEGLASQTLHPVPQRHDEATLAPILRRSDGDVDFALGANEIAGHIRGFDPWPGVWCVGAGRRIRLLEAHPAEPGAARTDAAPGQVLELRDDALIVACGGGTTLAVTRLQPEARRPLSARDAVNGRVLRPGDRLESPPRD